MSKRQFLLIALVIIGSVVLGLVAAARGSAPEADHHSYLPIVLGGEPPSTGDMVFVPAGGGRVGESGAGHDYSRLPVGRQGPEL